MQRKIYLATALVAALSLPAVAYGQTTLEQQRVMLESHNIDRALHCVPPLQWSDALAANAQAWANGCHKNTRGSFIHQPSNPNGENLSWGWATSNGQPILPAVSPEQAVQRWYNEISNYDFNDPILQTDGIAPTNGHFTQVVWRATTHLGCAQATCPVSTSRTNPSITTPGTLWVCEYSPPGNFNANPQTLAQNVPRPCN
jgi:uncharacterized protein YkwD